MLDEMVVLKSKTKTSCNLTIKSICALHIESSFQRMLLFGIRSNVYDFVFIRDGGKETHFL